MRLRPDQLAAHLGRGLAPVYLVHGDEPLLAQEAADAVRARAREAGCDERECLAVEPGFDWSALASAGNSLSLFGSRRLIELRLGNVRPGDAGARALRAYCARPPEDAVLLVLAGKLDAQQLKSAWFGAIDQAGVAVQCWPVEARALPGWIEARASARGMRLGLEAGALLASRVEGNLLACAQELGKLYLLYGSEPVDAERLLAVVGDSARYSVYDLADAGLEGRPDRAARIIAGLRAEGTEPVLACWALTREIRSLALLAAELERGIPVDGVLTRAKVWERRKPLIRRALGRLSRDECRRLLQACARADRINKGAEDGDAWDALLDIAVRLAGRDLRLGRELT